MLSLALAAASAAPAYASTNIVDAGVDQVVDWGDTVTLDGSWTFGSGSTILPLSSTWTQTAGSPTVTIADPNALVTTFSTDTRTIGTDTVLTFKLDAEFAPVVLRPSTRTTHSDTVDVAFRPMALPSDSNFATTSSIAAYVGGFLDGATIQLHDKTYHFATATEIVMNKELTLKGPATLTGNVNIVIRDDNVTIKDLTMKNLDSSKPAISVNGVNTYGSAVDDRENVVIRNNTIHNTRDHGIMLWHPPGISLKNITIQNNTLTDIGRNEALPAAGTDRDGALKTAIYLHPAVGARIQSLDIADNTIRNPSFGGINLNSGVLVDTHVSGNTIEETLAFAIQAAARPDRDYAGETLYIYDNRIRDANNSLVYPKVINDGGSVAYDFTDGKRETTPEAAILIWTENNRHIKVYDNVIRDSRNGLILCQGGCGVHDEFVGQNAIPRFTIATTPVDHSIDVYNNSFISNAGRDVVNLSPTQLVAGYNYWGDGRGPYASLDDRVLNNVNYLPAYADEQRQTLRLVSSGLSADSQPSACSAAGSSVSFSLVTGGESRVTSQSVTNVGNLAFNGLQVRVGPWTDGHGNEYSTLTTSVKSGGQFVELTPGEFVALDVGLPAPGSSSEIELKVVHSGRLLPTGEDSLSQAMSFFASCG